MVPPSPAYTDASLASDQVEYGVQPAAATSASPVSKPLFESRAITQTTPVAPVETPVHSTFREQPSAAHLGVHASASDADLYEVAEPAVAVVNTPQVPATAAPVQAAKPVTSTLPVVAPQRITQEQYAEQQRRLAELQRMRQLAVQELQEQEAQLLRQQQEYEQQLAAQPVAPADKVEHRVSAKDGAESTHGVSVSAATERVPFANKGRDDSLENLQWNPHQQQHYAAATANRAANAQQRPNQQRLIM